MPDTNPQRPARLSAAIGRELGHLFRPNPSDRPWEFPFAAALAVGMPMIAGAWLEDIAAGTLASIGAMTILYLPRTALDHRMATIMATAFAMILCYAVGELCHLFPQAHVPMIALVATLVAIGCRYHRLHPGPIFFVMTTSIAAYAPGDVTDAPAKLGIFALGCISAVIVGFFYTLHIRRFRDPLPAAAPRDDLRNVIVESIIIGLCVGLSLGVAQLFALEKPYWVPVSCLAVIQAASLRAVWTRKAHRIAGTIAGLGVAWTILQFTTDAWGIAVAVIVLTFVIETAVVRHYAVAAMFFTPVTILLAEAPTLGSGSITPLMLSRLIDTVLGASIGMIGGVCLHNAGIRARLDRWLPGGGTRAAP